MSPNAIDGTVEQGQISLNQDVLPMSLRAFEGTVEQGQIRLKGDVRLPEHTKVYVIIPGNQDQRALRGGPPSENPAESSDFETETTEDGIDARA